MVDKRYATPAELAAGGLRPHGSPVGLGECEFARRWSAWPTGVYCWVVYDDSNLRMLTREEAQFLENAKEV